MQPTEAPSCEHAARLMVMSYDPALGAGKDDATRLEVVSVAYHTLRFTAFHLYSPRFTPDEQVPGFAKAATWEGYVDSRKALTFLLAETRRVIRAAKTLMVETLDADVFDQAQSIRMRAASLAQALHHAQAQMRLALRAGQKADAFLDPRHGGWDRFATPREALVAFLLNATQSPYLRKLGSPKRRRAATADV